MYSPARLLEDSEPCGKKHSQSGGRRRNCDGKGAQGTGSQWNQERTHSYQGAFLSMLSINLVKYYLLVNKHNFSLILVYIVSFVCVCSKNLIGRNVYLIPNLLQFLFNKVTYIVTCSIHTLSLYWEPPLGYL